MRTPRPRLSQAILAALVLGTLSPLAGCGSSQDGTHVQVSEEAKAQVQSRRDMYKANADAKQALKAKAKTSRRP